MPIKLFPIVVWGMLLVGVLLVVVGVLGWMQLHP
jgi:hypothetical protein